MFKERFLSSIILVIVALVTVIAGGPVLAVLSLVISIIGLTELYKVSSISNTVLGYVGYVGTVVYYALIYMDMREYVFMMILILLVIFMAVYVVKFPTYHANQLMLAFFGFFYVAVMISFIYQTRMLEHGIFSVWLVFISSWICDTCAYCVGVLLGKRKMAPILSPKKSVEGAIGGLVGAGIVGAIYGYCITVFVETAISPMIFAIICVLGGLISMIGDLAASGIKRDNNVKDYGKLIPGHGGILDRFDSVIFTAPIIYYLTVYLIS